MAAFWSVSRLNLFDLALIFTSPVTLLTNVLALFVYELPTCTLVILTLFPLPAWKKTTPVLRLFSLTV